MRNLIFGTILALSANASRKMRMVIAADNAWTLYVTAADGTKTNLGQQTDWFAITTIEQVLKGPGPWTLTAVLEDTGFIAGFWNALWIDDKPYSQTSKNGAFNKWQIYDNGMPPNDDSGKNWETPAYTPSIGALGWKANFASTPDCVALHDGDWHNGTYWAMNTRIPAEIAPFEPLPEKVYPLWYPNCSNSQVKHYYRMDIPAREPAPIIDGRNIEMVMAVDNTYNMSITDKNGVTTPWAFSTNWWEVSIYRKFLSGSGPWTITVLAVDTGVIAGFFATNWVDGNLYSVTGIEGSANKWEIWPAIGPSFQEPPSDGKFDWTHPSYNITRGVVSPTVQWIRNHATTDDCSQNKYSQSFWKKLNDYSTPVKMGQIWYPNCKTVNVKHYYRLIIPAIPI